MVIFVNWGEMHGKEISRLSIMPIIFSGSVLIRRTDRVRPERGWTRRASGYPSERPVEHLLHDRVAWAFGQPKKTVNGSSMS